MIKQDVSSEWLNVARAAQATCGGGKNAGFAVITLKVIVFGKKPLLWSEPEMTLIHPKKASGLQMTPGLASALAIFTKADGGEYAQ